jgi:hypothetical protein
MRSPLTANALLPWMPVNAQYLRRSRTEVDASLRYAGSTSTSGLRAPRRGSDVRALLLRVSLRSGEIQDCSVIRLADLGKLISKKLRHLLEIRPILFDGICDERESGWSFRQNEFAGACGPNPDELRMLEHVFDIRQRGLAVRTAQRIWQKIGRSLAGLASWNQSKLNQPLQVGRRVKPCQDADRLVACNIAVHKLHKILKTRSSFALPSAST